MTTSNDVVLFSLEAWDDVWRRNQFLVRELLAEEETARVLFVEPAFDVRVERRVTFSSPLRPGPLPRLWLYRPVKLLPRAAGPWADRSLLRGVRKAMRRLGFGRAVLWVNDASYAGVCEWNLPVVCDVTDDWTALAPSRTVARYRQRENLLLEKADEVVVCSPSLQASKRRDRTPTPIPNAVDIEHFQQKRRRPDDLPGGPVLLYLGTLHDERIDLDLVESLAMAVPGTSVVLVGPNAFTEETRARLGTLGRVHILGSRPYDDVPAYYQHADVIIIPHRVTPFTESLDPIKLYEVLASGTPAVATPVAGFRDAPLPVHVAPSESFAAQVQELLEHRPERQVGSAPTWKQRANDFLGVLDRARARRLRVVYLDHTAKLSGAELALARVLPHIPGVEPLVLLGEPGPLVQRLEAAGTTVKVRPMGSVTRDLPRSSVGMRLTAARAALGAARYAVALARWLRHEKPDLVHTNSLKASMYGSLAAWLAGVPSVWHARDRVASDYLPTSAVWLVRAFAFLFPSAVIANSSTTLDCLRIGRHPFRVVPSPVVHDAAQASAVLRHPSTGGLVVCMLGRLAPWKGQHVFLEAFSKAFPEGAESGIIAGAALFGEEAYERELHELARRSPAASRISFAGFVDDVPGLLAEVDVLVHASTVPEPFGQVVIEGMAAGVAVVAADAGGPAEVVTNGVDGLLFPPGDVDALASCLQRLASDTGLRHSLAQSGVRTSEAFKPERVGEAIRDVYDMVLGARR